MNFQARVASAVMQGTLDTQENDAPTRSDQQRNAFGELETVTDDHRVATVRSSTTVRKFQNSNRLLPTVLKPGASTGTSSSSNNKQFTILNEENNAAPSVPSLVHHSKIALPIHSTMKTENTHRATKWSDVPPVVNEVVSAPAATSRITVISSSA